VLNPHHHDRHCHRHTQLGVCCGSPADPAILVLAPPGVHVRPVWQLDPARPGGPRRRVRRQVGAPRLL